MRSQDGHEPALCTCFCLDPGATHCWFMTRRHRLCRSFSICHPHHPPLSLPFLVLGCFLRGSGLSCSLTSVGFGPWESLAGDGGVRGAVGVFLPCLPRSCISLYSPSPHGALITRLSPFSPQDDNSFLMSPVSGDPASLVCSLNPIHLSGSIPFAKASSFELSGVNPVSCPAPD